MPVVRASALCSGSSGNAIFIETGTDKFVVDCGLNGKKFADALATLNILPRDLTGILITHEHRDHISGLGVILRKYQIPFYMTEATYKVAQPEIGDFDVNLLHYIPPNQDFVIGDSRITPFKLSHDAVEPRGFRFVTPHGDVSICTDTGKITGDMVSALAGSKVIFLEANYDEYLLRSGPYPYWLKHRISSDLGHLSNLVAAKFLQFLISTGTSHIVLSHLSHKNNYPQLAALTVRQNLAETGEIAENDYSMTVAKRYTPSPVLAW